MPNTEINVENKLEQAHILIQQSNYVRAKSMAQQVLEVDIQNAEAYGIIGLCESHFGNYKQADELHGIALGLEPENDYLHYLRGYNYHKMNEHQLSLVAIDEALRLNPDRTEYLSIKAINQLNLGDTHEARLTIDRALEISPDSDNLLRIKAVVWHHLGNSQDALATINKSIAENPQSSLAFADKGRIYLQIKRPDRAMDEFNEALRIDPNNESAKIWMLSARKRMVPVIGRLMDKGFDKRVWTTPAKSRLAYIIGMLILSRGLALIGFPIIFGGYWGLCAWLSVGYDSYLSYHPTHRYLLLPHQYRTGRWALLVDGLLLALLISAAATNYKPLWQVWITLLVAYPIAASYFYLETTKAKQIAQAIMFLGLLGLGCAFLGGFIPFMLTAVGFFCLYFFFFSFRVFGG